MDKFYIDSRKPSLKRDNSDECNQPCFHPRVTCTYTLSSGWGLPQTCSRISIDFFLSDQYMINILPLIIFLFPISYWMILANFRLLRYIAYRRFVRLIWKRLSKKERRILPSCVVTKIRAAFPSDETYTGFLPPRLEQHTWNLEC